MEMKHGPEKPHSVVLCVAALKDADIDTTLEGNLYETYFTRYHFGRRYACRMCK
jgi:hypothetical protein